MTDDTQPEAMDLADWLEAVGGGPSAKRCAALLREQHARIAELESELEAVGAGGVQALSAAPAVPAGWKAVPVNPTPEMWKAAKTVPDPNPPYPPHYGLVWDAMLAATPTPPAEQPPRWVERWHGSGGKEFWEGWSILNAANREMIAHLGPDVDPDAVRGIVAAHNEALCGECAGTGGRWCPACAGASPPAEQQASATEVALVGAYARLPDFDSGDEPIWEAVFKWKAANPGSDASKKAMAVEGAIIKSLRDFADRTHALRMQAAPKAEPGVGNSGFDYKTAADFLNGKTVSDEAVRKFVAASRWAHDERAALSATLLAMHGVLTSREAEIALLKKALLEAEAAPQQQAPDCHHRPPCDECAAIAAQGGKDA